MTKGKNICKTLKNIRQKIADENGISYAPRECHYQGDCLGTCPACEQEVLYLESELQKRRKIGLTNKIAGIAAGICALAMPMEMQAQTVVKTAKDTTPVLKKDLPITDLSKGEIDSITIKGIVTNSLKEPQIGTYINVKGTSKNAIADINGQFAIKAAKDAELEFSYLGMETKVVKVKNLKHPSNVSIILKELMMGEADVFHDDVYGHYTHKIKRNKKK